MQLDLEFRSKQSNSLQRKTKLDNKTIFNTNESVSKTELNSSSITTTTTMSKHITTSSNITQAAATTNDSTIIYTKTAKQHQSFLSSSSSSSKTQITKSIIASTSEPITEAAVTTIATSTNTSSSISSIQASTISTLTTINSNEQQINDLSTQDKTGILKTINKNYFFFTVRKGIQYYIYF